MHPSLYLNEWCKARLRDSRESGEIDEGVSDAVIEREAEKLEIIIHKMASSFVDNEFNEKDEFVCEQGCGRATPDGCQQPDCPHA